MSPSFLLLHDITNEKILKLEQIDRLPALKRFWPQKHVPTTPVGIPVDIYTLATTIQDMTTTTIQDMTTTTIQDMTTTTTTIQDMTTTTIQDMTTTTIQDTTTTTIQDMTTTTIQDINQIIVLISVRRFSFSMKELLILLRYQLIVIND